MPWEDVITITIIEKMAYVDDKRIRDLNTQPTLLLNDFLAMDRTGALEATKFTIQSLANLINAQGVKQIAYANTTAPDNAFGLKGDLFYQIPENGSFIKMFQKGVSTWSLVFNLPLPYQEAYTQANLSLRSPDDYTLSVTIPLGRAITGVAIVYADNSQEFLAGGQTSLIVGFTNANPQNIYVKYQ